MTQAAFLLPVLTKMIQEGLHGSSFSEIQEPQAIVIGPTRELVVQIYNEARKFSFNTMLRPVVVYGGTSVGHQLQQISKGAHMVVGTPGRLKDFIERGKVCNSFLELVQIWEIGFIDLFKLQKLC